LQLLDAQVEQGFDEEEQIEQAQTGDRQGIGSSERRTAD
jgi:hypothetical protein